MSSASTYQLGSFVCQQIIHGLIGSITIVTFWRYTITLAIIILHTYLFDVFMKKIWITIPSSSTSHPYLISPPSSSWRGSRRPQCVTSGMARRYRCVHGTTPGTPPRSATPWGSGRCSWGRTWLQRLYIARAINPSTMV